jgi:hypothetical protein
VRARSSSSSSSSSSFWHGFGCSATRAKNSSSSSSNFRHRFLLPEPRMMSYPYIELNLFGIDLMLQLKISYK